MRLKHFDHDRRARFITFCTQNRIPVLTNDRYRKVVLDSINYICAKNLLKLIAYVIMPEHVHLVIVPPENVRLGPLIGKMKQISSFKIHKIVIATNSHLKDNLMIKRDQRGNFTLWQRRCFDHNCRDEQALWKVVNYCRNNPVIRGLVSKSIEWKWSSYNNFHYE